MPGEEGVREENMGEKDKNEVGRKGSRHQQLPWAQSVETGGPLVHLALS